jgi:hypothetical protein
MMIFLIFDIFINKKIMKKIVRLTESDLARIVKRIINEGITTSQITELANKELVTDLEYGTAGLTMNARPMKKMGNSFYGKLDKTKEKPKKPYKDKTIVSATVQFIPDTFEGCVGQITINSFSYRKVVDKKQFKNIKNINDSPVYDLIWECGDAWVSMCNENASKNELTSWLKQRGWDQN